MYNKLPFADTVTEHKDTTKIMGGEVSVWKGALAIRCAVDLEIG